MVSLFDEFLKEKKYLQNCSPHTLTFYELSYKAYKRVLSEPLQQDNPLPTKHTLTSFVIGLREEGKSVGCVNAYIRGFNSYLSWLFENGHTPERLNAKQLKSEQKVIKPFSDDQIRLLLSWKPESFVERRLHALICLLLDTGIRIDEALTLERSKVDFDNLLLTVRGKGNKERTLPFSIETRRVLFRFLKTHPFELVFPGWHGQRLGYRNCLRDFKLLCIELKIYGVRTSFHTLRHSFASFYVRHGGSAFHLQRMLGHTTLAMTRKYVELETRDLQEIHSRTSILARLR